MSAESINEQEKLHIKDNETIQLEEGTTLMKLCKVNSLSNISSKSTENIDSYVEIASKCVQINTDTHDNKVSCQSDEKTSQNLEKPVTIIVGSINEQVCCNDKIDDLIINKNLITQAAVDKDINDSPKPNQVTRLSDDYVMQMTKTLNDKHIALYEGVFLEADKQNSPSLQQALISDETKKNNNKDLDNLQMIVKNNNKNEEKLCLTEKYTPNDFHIEKGNEKESIDQYKIENNSDNEEKSCLKEKSMTVDSNIEKNCEKRFIDENKTSTLNLLLSNELLIEESNKTNDTTEIENLCKSAKLANNSNVNQFTNERISVDKLENIDLKKAFSHSKLKDITPSVEPDTLISRLQHMDWLKPTGHELMEISRRKMACKSSIEKEQYNEDIKEELADDTKINSKANKKRSNQRKNPKPKAAESFKQDDIEDKNKKSSNDVELTNTSKNEISKSAIGRVFEKPKETKAIQLPVSQRTCIGRGRSDRRKILFGNAQPKGQTDINDQRNESHKCSPEDRLPTMIEKNSSKNEAHYNAEDSSNKIEKLGDDNDNTIVTTDSTKPKEQEVCETNSDSKSHQNIKSLHTQSLVANTAALHTQSLVANTAALHTQSLVAKTAALHTQSLVANTAESSTQEKKSKIDIKKDQLPSKNHQESKNRPVTNLPSRPIYGRSIDKSNSEKTLCSVRGFGQKIDEPIKNNKQPSQNLSSKDNVNRFSEQTKRNEHENKINQSYSSLLKSQDESCSNKYTTSSSTYTSSTYTSSTYDQDFPRWNHNNNSDKQNISKDEMTLHKTHTSNKHRNIADDKKENEESISKNQVFTDKSQGSKRYTDKYQDSSKTFVGRYSDRNQDTNNFHDKHPDKNHDDKNYAERLSNRNQDCKSYRDTDFDRPHANRKDTYFDNNHRSRGFGERFSDMSQDRPYSSNYSNKFRDNKGSGDRYFDNQQSKTSNEIFYNKKHDDNKMATNKQESFNTNSVSFDKNDKCSDKNHIATKSLDSSRGNPGLPDKNNEIPNSPKATYSRSYPTNEHINENSNENNHQPFDKDNNFGNQDTSHTIEPAYNVINLCPQHQQEQLEQFTNNFWKTPDQIDSFREMQYKSDVKSQKHFDNTQQVKVQMGLNHVQQSYSVPPVACQQELSSTVDHNIEFHERITSLTSATKSPPNQSEYWYTNKNTLNHDIIYSSEYQSPSPFANLNIASNPAAINEYSLQYNQTLLDLSNQFNNSFGSGQKSNILMTFEGNQNVQRALGMDSRIANQSQFSQMNSNDFFRSNTNSPILSQSLYTNENVADFFQSAVGSLQTNQACMHSTMNVNAQPFEVTKQSNQESNKQQMYTLPTVSNHGQSGLVSQDNDCLPDIARNNDKSNYTNEYLRLRKEICELSQQLALKQGELLALELKLHQNTRDKAESKLINQLSCSPIQHISNNQPVQETNQTLPSSYLNIQQVKHSNCSLGYGDVTIDMQNAQLNYKMPTNANNAQNYTNDSLSSSGVSELKSNAQSVYLAQDNMYQQQTATYQTYPDKTANSASYVNMMPYGAKNRHIRSFSQFP